MPIKDYEKILDELDELEDISLYDEAKKNDTGERIPMEEAFRMIEAKRKKKAWAIRIIYDIFDTILVVDVIAVGHRKDIYE